MLSAKGLPSEPVELVRSDLRGVWPLLFVPVALGIAAVLLVERTGVAVLTSVAVGAVFVATILLIRALAGRQAIFVDSTGLIEVSGERARRVAAWERLRSALWHAGSFWSGWDPGALIIAVEGERAPRRVGRIVIVRGPARARASERIGRFLSSLESSAPPPAGDRPEEGGPEMIPRPATVDAGRPWWRDGVLYHVYLRSFADSDGDGVGDIPGLIARLDHLAWLGVAGVWVSPVMPSPNDDFGYDVSDYTGVDPQYGTMEDVDLLIKEAGDRGMRVLFDLVPNHSSTSHAWFAESRSSRTSPKRDWYVWADPKADGSPPNNWVGNFFGPSWTLDEATGQYYLSSFLPTQADLNWWNEEVRQAFDDALRFWFDRGVAGFRIDVVHKLIKDPALPDNPPPDRTSSVIEQAWGQRELHNANQPETHEIVRRWRRVAQVYDDPPILIGETYVLDIPLMASYYGAGDELDLAFNIPFLWATFDAPAMRAVIDATEAAIPEGSWPVWNGGSHDISRMATRWCGNDGRKIRCALMLLLMMRGTPLLYYGDEIGMPDGDVPLDRALDPLGKRVPGVVTAGRDPARTPMQWSGEPGAGFTRSGVETWLPLGDAVACNVEDQRADPTSVLWLARDLIALRREGVTAPRTEWIDAPPAVLAWRRGDATVAINLSDDAGVVTNIKGRVRVGTRRERDGEAIDGSLALAPWEGVVLYE